MSSSATSSSEQSTLYKPQTQRAKTCQVKDKKKKFYFTSGRIKAKDLEESDRLVFNAYKVPYELKSMEEVKRYWREEEEMRLKEKNAGFVHHHTYSSRLRLQWKRERLYVADDTKLSGKCITDIDPDFFTMVSGRPIKEKKDLRQYVKDIRNCFLTRLKTGYLLDEILLMDEQHINEKEKLEEVRTNFLTYSKCFDEFLKEDHDTSLSLLKLAERKTKKSKEKLEVVNGLREELKRLQADVLVLEEKWRKCKLYQKFLNIVAPSEWRKVNDPYFGKKDVGVIASDPGGFDNFREFPGVTNIDLNVKISKFKEDVEGARIPVLYFTDPQELLDILDNLERNNQVALAHCKKLDFPAEKIIAELEKAKVSFQQAQTSLEEEVKFLMTLVEEEEEKSKANEEKLREIAFGLFRDLITNEEYLSVISLVEDAYEDAVAPNDDDLDVLTMMKEIELKHESLVLILDLLPNDVVVRTTRRFYREQKRDMEEAREAERKVHQMETLLKRLSKSLAPPKSGARERRIMRRSLPPREIFVKYEQPKILTKEEREEVFFFETSEEAKLYKPLFA